MAEFKNEVAQGLSIKLGLSETCMKSKYVLGHVKESSVDMCRVEPFYEWTFFQKQFQTLTSAKGLQSALGRNHLF